MCKQLAHLAFVLAIAAGCSRSSSYLAAKADNPRHREIVESASNYQFTGSTGPISATVPVAQLGNSGVPDTEAPTDITIEQATWSGPSPAPTNSQIVARIHTQVGYKPLHIPAGYSYIWRDLRGPTSPNDRWQAWIVPVLLSDPMKPWKRNSDLEEFSDGDPHESRLVFKEWRDNYILAACIDDPACTPAGHCGYGALE